MSDNPIYEKTPPEILESIDSFNSQIKKNRDDFMAMVGIRTFDECKSLGCTHTKGCRWCCRREYSCIHNRTAWSNSTFPIEDCYEPMVITQKTYPTYGWKKAYIYYPNRTELVDVVKETNKFLVFSNGEKFNKKMNVTCGPVGMFQYYRYRISCADNGAKPVERKKPTPIKLTDKEMIDIFGD